MEMSPTIFLTEFFDAIQVQHLKRGDMVDLQRDIFADPKGTDPQYEMEYCTVEKTVKETDTCTLVHFENSVSIGFPSTHYVRVHRNYLPR